jgi:hypothetical protein
MSSIPYLFRHLFPKYPSNLHPIKINYVTNTTSCNALPIGTFIATLLYMIEGYKVVFKNLLYSGFMWDVLFRVQHVFILQQFWSLFLLFMPSKQMILKFSKEWVRVWKGTKNFYSQNTMSVVLMEYSCIIMIISK